MKKRKKLQILAENLRENYFPFKSMKNNITKIIAFMLLLAIGMSSCGPDYFLKRHKFYRYKKHWHRRWARPGGHRGAGYF